MNSQEDGRTPTARNGSNGDSVAGSERGIVMPKRSVSRASERSDGTFHSSTANVDDGGTFVAGGSTAALRSQIHELKHILRQKTAVIASLEQKAGVPVGSAERMTRKTARGRNSLPAPGAVSLSPMIGGSARIRTASMDRTAASASRGSPLAVDDQMLPFSDVANTAGQSASTAGRRRRKNAENGINTPDRIHTSLDDAPGSNSLGLETVRESDRRGSPSMLGEGFLSPTIASESRRLANTNALASPIETSPGGFAPSSASSSGHKGTGKVIESLTTELHAARVALDDTKMQLRTSQRTVTTLQRSLDETRESLTRSRSEYEASGRMLTRKDRLHQEVLERARKAEAESKELGKSSREWGARVRKVEAELGEERIQKQRAEMQYEAIAATWKQTREAWEKEMQELRMTHGETAKRNRATLDEIAAQYKQRDHEGRVLRDAVGLLEQERKKAATYVVGPVRELMEQLKLHETHTSSHDSAVQDVQDELKRIIRLMRSHDLG